MKEIQQPLLLQIDTCIVKPNHPFESKLIMTLDALAEKTILPKNCSVSMQETILAKEID